MFGTGKAGINISSMQAGEYGVFTIVYETGEYGIDDSGEIIITRRDVCDSAIPQFDDPAMEGYVSVTSDSSAKLVVEYLPTRYIRPWKACISIKVRDGSLYPGEKVYIRFGDKDGPGYRIQTYPEVSHTFRVLIDCAGSGNFYDLDESPVISITGGDICSAEACGPSISEPGKPFSIVVRAMDSYGNIADGFSGFATLSINNLERSLNIINGTAKASELTLTDTGIFTPEISIIGKDITGYGNPLMCGHGLSNIFWGDMHGQTGETVGTGTPDLYFSFARDKANMDFSGWQGNDFQITDETWADINEKVKKYNEPGKFVCFLGYEWSGTTPMGGDHNIYFLNDDQKIHRSYHWQIGMEDQDGSARSPLSALWEEFKGRDDVMAIPHVGGRYGNFDYFNPEFIPVVEIHSHHGSFEWFFRDILARGFKPGVIAASDDHSCRPGLSFPTEVSSRGGFVSFDVKGGYTAVLSETLDRQSIWNAIRERHCYATSGERIIASVTCGDNVMGDEFELNSPPVFDIDIIGTAGIKELYVMRNLDIAFSLNETRPRDENRIFIEWSGVRVKSRAKKTKWDGTVFVKHGSIIEVNDYDNQKRGRRTELISGNLLKFYSSTSGDTDGFELKMVKTSETAITVKCEQAEFTFNTRELLDNNICHSAGGVNLEIRAGHPPIETGSRVELQFIDGNIEKGMNAYWVKAVQVDGHMLWTSPMYITYA